MGVERVHAVLRAGLDVRGDSEGLAVADEGLNGGRGDHDLERGHASGLVDAGQEHLGDDGDETGGQLGADLRLLVGREGVDDTVDGGRGAGGVQGAEDQVTGFGGGHGGFDGDQVAQFADEDDVGVLTEGAAEGFGEARDVRADFTLDHHALLVVVVEFDGVLDRDDVHGAFLVDDVDHGGEGGGLAGTGRAGHEDHAAGTVEQVLDARREPDLVQRHHLVRDLTEHGSDAAFLLERADAETRAVAERETEVRAAVFGELLEVAGGGDRFDQRFRVFRLENREVELGHFTVEADHGRYADFEMQVAAAFGDDEVQ